MKTKMVGESKTTGQMESDTGDSQSEAETQKELNILAMMKNANISTLTDFLKENPEVVLSELHRILNLLTNSDYWFAITPIIADGIKLVRITIAPPEGYDLEILENIGTETKKIVINKSVQL